MKLHNFVQILPQPDDITCGPTSLHAVYRYFGMELALEEVIGTVKSLEGGGTLAVMLGVDALKRGFDATIYSYNLKMFDPSWKNDDNDTLINNLEHQLQYKSGKKFVQATRAYQSFLHLGGRIKFEDLHRDLLKRYLVQNIPILTGLSATYLYDSTREYTNRKNQSVFDPIKGEPVGHFVVLCGIKGATVYVADPYKENPYREKIITM
ncbi:C39 family peptidase [Geofilum rubicundum]|uniref:C39 family peptidase n=1 Tax=Geofilum rubicundum TaxID=472113 RepID=UPI000A571602|nr:C39 family peptidase [Geofilum rubicundum]